MSRLSLPLRIALGVASLAVSALCLLYYVGLMPDATSANLERRKSLCEAIAIHCSMDVLRGDFDAIGATTGAILQRNPDLVSAEVRLTDGRLLAPFGVPAANRPAGLNHVSVPIYLNKDRWGAVEVWFRPLVGASGLPVPLDLETRFIGLFALLSLATNYAYLSFILKKSSQAKGAAIPDRVRATLDTLVEGVLLMDGENRIALANTAFAKKVGRSVAELENQTAEALEWIRPDAEDRPSDLPWNAVFRGGSRNLGVPLAIRAQSTGERHRLSVNSTPIVSDSGARVGVLATFDDLTEVEKKNDQLRKLLDKLRDKRVELERANKRLQELATKDPLTGCLNRRAFFEHFDAAWKAAERYNQPLSVVMLDIDHFKSVNDRHGHAIGDEALKVVSAVLKSMVRAHDFLCRYGGEEFCILFTNTGVDDAETAAERIRKAIAAEVFANISVTSSFGVASNLMGASDPHDLLNRADKSLYAAKRGGRNRVVRFDRLPEESPEAEAESTPAADSQPVPATPTPEPTTDPANPIPYHAVTSLVAALAHRDPETASHSRRVADLCVATARGLLSGRDCYVLEIAALLHDVGKLGIPDNILKKPGPLNDAEWNVMRAHDRMGIEIITAAFSSPMLSEIVRNHHAWYDGKRGSASTLSGEHIPEAARILAIADAYDAIVSDRVYRPGKPPEAALAELRRCAGTQFDPALVERFAGVIALIDRDRKRVPGAAILTPLSKHAALKVGLHIEKLANALDTENVGEVKAAVAKVQAAAQEFQIAPIAEMAGRLDQAVLAEAAWVDVLEIADLLLDLCRATQASYLATYREEPLAERPPPPPSLSADWLATPA